MAESTNVTYYIKAEVNNVRDRYEDTTDVVLTIHGSNGQTEPLTLKLNKANKVDNFEFEALDVGTLSKINLSHTINLGGVYIETITIKKSNKSSSVNVNKWLEDNGEKSFDFNEISSAPATRASSKLSSRQKSATTRQKSASTKRTTNSAKSVRVVEPEETNSSTKEASRQLSPKEASRQSNAETTKPPVAKETSKPDVTNKTEFDMKREKPIDTKTADKSSKKSVDTKPVSKKEPAKSESDYEYESEDEKTSRTDYITAADREIALIESTHSKANQQGSIKSKLRTTLMSASAIYTSNAAKNLRESSIDESVLLSNMKFDDLTPRVNNPEREKLSKISQSINPSRQSERTNTRLDTLHKLYHSNRSKSIYSQDVPNYGPSRLKVLAISESRQGKLKPENKPIKNGEFELATHIELKRVKTKIYKEVAKIKYPRRKEYHPFVFNDLSPYTETRLAENLICSSEYNQPIGYCNRFTAMSIVEPWVAHRMEHTIGPYVSRSLQTNVRSKVSKGKLNRPSQQFQGSTLAPSFPKVVIKKPKGMDGPFYYDDVEIIRSELQKNLKNRSRYEEDRNRTINDYYRMNLDQTSESLKMTGAYHAYLENTPGSKAALGELLGTSEKTY